MGKTVLIAAMAALPLAGVLAQDPDPQPTCRMCPASYIPNDEIQAYVKKDIAEKLTDQQVRDIDIGKSNVAVGVVHRGKLAQPAPESVAEHDFVSEVYHVIEGSATLVTGPDLVGNTLDKGDVVITENRFSAPHKS